MQLSVEVSQAFFSFICACCLIYCFVFSMHKDFMDFPEFFNRIVLIYKN